MTETQELQARTMAHAIVLRILLEQLKLPAGLREDAARVARKDVMASLPREAHVFATAIADEIDSILMESLD